jgi:hypothetical protein
MTSQLNQGLEVGTKIGEENFQFGSKKKMELGWINNVVLSYILIVIGSIIGYIIITLMILRCCNGWITC